jgi:hypothetical protein
VGVFAQRGRTGRLVPKKFAKPSSVSRELKGEG